MSTPLRPMSTGEILDRTFNLYRNNFVLFVGIAALPPALMLLVNVIEAAMLATPGQKAVRPGLDTAGGVGMIIAAIAYLIGMAAAHAAGIFAVSAVHLGRETSVSESYHRVKGRYGRVVWVIIQAGLRSVGPFVLLMIIAAIAIPNMLKAGGGGMGGAVAGLIIVLAMIVAGVAAIVLYLRYALAVQACVLEDIKASAAIKRSVSLSAGSRGRIFVIYFLMTLITYIVLFVFAFPAGLLATAVVKGSLPVATLFNGLATFLSAALAGPIATIALSLVYYDQRVRKEAFDIQLMVAALDGTGPVAGAQSAGVSAG